LNEVASPYLYVLDYGLNEVASPYLYALDYGLNEVASPYLYALDYGLNEKVRQPHSNHNPEHKDKVGQPD
jgi:hypothetical protein